MKKLLSILLIAILTLGIVGCSKKEDTTNKSKNDSNVTKEKENTEKKENTKKTEKKEKEKVKIKVGTLKGPTGMGMAKLMEDSKQGKTEGDYEFVILDSPDDLMGKIISKEVDVAAVPSNAALSLYNKTEGEVQLAAVNTLGVLYIVENGETINSIEDLKGKTIGSSGQGATPDFVLQYLLGENGIKEETIVDFKQQHSDLAATLVAGDEKIGLLPEPFVTNVMMQNESLRIALDITKEWEKAQKSKLVMGSLAVQKEFAKDNKASFDTFLDEYEKSVKYVNEEVDSSSKLIAKFGIIPKAEIAKKAIPNSSMVYIDAQKAKKDLNDFFQVLYDLEPKSVGGSLADDEFYYKK